MRVRKRRKRIYVIEIGAFIFVPCILREHGECERIYRSIIFANPYVLCNVRGVTWRYVRFSVTNIVSRGSKILARRLLCSMREIKKRVCARRVQEIHVYIGCYVSARISSVRRVSSHIFTKNFENIERETFFSVDSCRQIPPSYYSSFPPCFTTR